MKMDHAQFMDGTIENVGLFKKLLNTGIVPIEGIRKVVVTSDALHLEMDLPLHECYGDNEISLLDTVNGPEIMKLIKQNQALPVTLNRGSELMKLIKKNKDIFVPGMTLSGKVVYRRHDVHYAKSKTYRAVQRKVGSWVRKCMPECGRR